MTGCADRELRGVADGHRDEVARRVAQQEDREVGRRVGADDLGVVGASVVQRDVDRRVGCRRRVATWLLVRMCPLLSMTTPEPWPPAWPLVTAIDDDARGDGLGGRGPVGCGRVALDHLRRRRAVALGRRGRARGRAPASHTGWRRRCRRWRAPPRGWRRRSSDRGRASGSVSPSARASASGWAAGSCRSRRCRRSPGCRTSRCAAGGRPACRSRSSGRCGWTRALRAPGSGSPGRSAPAPAPASAPGCRSSARRSARGCRTTGGRAAQGRSRPGWSSWGPGGCPAGSWLSVLLWVTFP